MPWVEDSTISIEEVGTSEILGFWVVGPSGLEDDGASVEVTSWVGDSRFPVEVEVKIEVLIS